MPSTVDRTEETDGRHPRALPRARPRHRGDSRAELRGTAPLGRRAGFALALWLALFAAVAYVEAWKSVAATALLLAISLMTPAVLTGWAALRRERAENR